MSGSSGHHGVGALVGLIHAFIHVDEVRANSGVIIRVAPAFLATVKSERKSSRVLFIQPDALSCFGG